MLSENAKIEESTCLLIKGKLLIQDVGFENVA